MGQYAQVDVAPNLGQLLGYQQENRLRYFTGTHRERAELQRHFADYKRNYRNYVKAYEQAVAAKNLPGVETGLTGRQ
jgi:hypothetical protein